MKRYYLDATNCKPFTCVMSEHEDGGYVQFNDVLELQQKIDECDLIGLIDRYIATLERTYTGWFARTRDGYTAEGDSIMTTVTKAISLDLFERVDLTLR